MIAEAQVAAATKANTLGLARRSWKQNKIEFFSNFSHNLFAAT
jgi:hypothetical protein